MARVFTLGLALAIAAPGCAAEPEETDESSVAATSAAVTACPVAASISRGWFSAHDGVDLAAPLGTPIYAVAGGLVTDSGPAQGYGQWIRIKHPDGSLTEYGHMRVREVRAGQQVKAGQRIALVGSEGEATGPHLHLRTYAHAGDGRGVDPIPYLRARGITLPCKPGIGSAAGMGLETPTKCPGGSGTVVGEINEKYLELGGCESKVLGLPKSDEMKTTDGKGRYSVFERGVIYWTPATKAHVVHGEILDLWKTLEREAGALGYPVGDEMTTPDEKGRYSVFEKGSIYWTPKTKAHEVLGPIRDEWKKQKWEAGPFGYPTTGQSEVPDGLRSDFEHGYITWNKGTNQTTPVLREPDNP